MKYKNYYTIAYNYHPSTANHEHGMEINGRESLILLLILGIFLFLLLRKRQFP